MGWQRLADSGYKLSSLRFGDFNNDQVTDVFISTGSQWKVSYGGTSQWYRLADSAFGVSSVALGDFVGDGRTDVLRTGTCKPPQTLTPRPRSPNPKPRNPNPKPRNPNSKPRNPNPKT